MNTQRENRNNTSHPVHLTLRALAVSVQAALLSLSMAAQVHAEQAAPKPDEPTLPEVKVKAEAEQETATGPVKGYVARASATGTKTDTPLIETPQSGEKKVRSSPVSVK
jgi:iron complex outermembrane receptor protein